MSAWILLAVLQIPLILGVFGLEFGAGVTEHPRL